MISADDFDTAIVLGMASNAMEYYARNGSEKRKQNAIDLIKEAAERLGFDLVPRKSAAILHAEAIAGVTAEEPAAVTAEPGFDGRDNTSIEDNIWSR